VQFVSERYEVDWGGENERERNRERERDREREISRKIKAWDIFFIGTAANRSRHLLQPDNNPPDRINDCRPFSRGHSISSAYDCTFGQPDSIHT